MLVYVPAHYHNFCSGGSVLGLPATSPAMVRAMQTCTVVDIPQSKTRFLKTTPKTQVSYSDGFLLMILNCILVGGALPLVLYNHVCTKGIFMGIIYFLSLILGNPLSRKKNPTSPNSQHPIGLYERIPTLFQMMLNYLQNFDLFVPYESKLKTPIWHGIYTRCCILVKEECNTS
jgi:hypothetical protein